MLSSTETDELSDTPQIFLSDVEETVDLQSVESFVPQQQLNRLCLSYAIQ